MRTKVLPEPWINALKRRPGVYRRLRAGRMRLGEHVPPIRHSAVTGPVHWNDVMVGGWSPQHLAAYERDGRRTFAIVAELADRHRVAGAVPWLDFGCGHGRVVRHIAAAFAPGDVWVTDIDGRAVDFCAGAFGVRRLPSQGRPTSFGTIQAISVLTHLPVDAAASLFVRWADLLALGGVLVATAHGASTLENLRRYGETVRGRRAEVERALESEGHAYLSYQYHAHEYGLAWYRQDRLASLAATATGGRLQLVEGLARGLDQHQDVYAFVRVEGGP